MRKESATLSSKGQLTLPVSVRKSIDIKQGDLLDVYEVDDKYIVIEKASVTPTEEILTRFSKTAAKKKLHAEDLADALRSVRKDVYRETYGSET